MAFTGGDLINRQPADTVLYQFQNDKYFNKYFKNIINLFYFMLNAVPSTFLKITFREADIKEALTAMALVFDCEMSVFRGRNLLFLAFEDPSVPSISAHCAMCTCAPPKSKPFRCRFLHTVYFSSALGKPRSKGGLVKDHTFPLFCIRPFAEKIKMKRVVGKALLDRFGVLPGPNELMGNFWVGLGIITCWRG